MREAGRERGWCKITLIVNSMPCPPCPSQPVEAGSSGNREAEKKIERKL
jgi:hypothetical protein